MSAGIHFKVSYMFRIKVSICAVGAAIWAEQQLVAIPGWLREDPNASLHQKGQSASIKEPRSPTTKKNKAVPKYRLDCIPQLVEERSRP